MQAKASDTRVRLPPPPKAHLMKYVFGGGVTVSTDSVESVLTCRMWYSPRYRENQTKNAKNTGAIARKSSNVLAFPIHSAVPAFMASAA